MQHDTARQQPAQHMNTRTRRRLWMTVAITVAAMLACLVAAAIVGLGGWWLFSMAMAGAVVGVTVGVLIPAAIEDGEVQEAERRAHGYRRGQADRVADDGPVAH